jgi:hypothetical protein
MFRNHALVGALAFVCTVFGATMPASVLAAEDNDGGSERIFSPLTVEQSRQAQAAQVGAIKTVPLSSKPIVPARYNGDVRDLPKISIPNYTHFLNEFTPPPIRRPPPQGQSATHSPTPLPPGRSAQMPAPTHDFAGLSFTTMLSGSQAGAGWPPDTNGDVGPTYYIQAVNDAWGIFDKGTGAMVAGFTENQLWSTAATGTPCDANNFGDPVVIHDTAADRWVLTDFAFAFTGGAPVAPFYQCFAVSQTNDPVGGGWYLYAVQMDSGDPGAPPANTFVDYPKFGFWTDCLYMGANGFDNGTGNYAGGVFAAFDRTTLFAGSPLTSTNSSVGFTGDTSIFGNFPANLNGSTLPPAGTPEYFVAESQVAYAFDVRTFQAGATSCGTGSTLSGATSVSQDSYGYPAIKVGTSYTSNMVRQASTGNRLDSLGDEIMQRVNYRNIGGTESLWVVHTTCGTGTDANGACATNMTPTQPQWAQIDVTGGTINTTPVQQQIYTPDVIQYRWMGSLAVDRQGNMAVGYSMTTNNVAAPTFPSLAYSGRLAGDPANQLGQTERVLAAGTASQNKCGTSSCSRWGDYSAMTIDPVDDCTFWYTNEYYSVAAHAANGHWDTNIGSFRFPGCTGPAAKLAFTVEPGASYAPNGTITVDVSVEDAAGDVVIGDTSQVTLALQGGTGGATLGGTTTVNAVAGVASFTVSVDLVGAGYSLHATDSSLTPDDSSTFDVVAPASITFTQQPTNAVAGVANSPAIVVTVKDGLNNPVAGDSVSLTVATGPGTLTVTSPQLTDASGNATFGDAVLTVAGTYTLNAADASLNVNSNSFTISPAAATLVFTTQPTDVVQGTVLNTIAVTKQDSFGNVYADSDLVDFTLPSCGTFDLGQVAMVSGVATLSSPVRFYTTAASLQVTANDATAVLSAPSSAFAVTANGDILYSDGFDGCRP